MKARRLRYRFLGALGWILLLAVASFAAILVTRNSAYAHNVAASGSYNCSGGWSYSANYLNGGGGGSTDNRLVVVDVSIGGTIIKEYRYFDTLTSHPSPPAGFTAVDHPTVTSSPLFSLSGATSPITVSGSIKMYSSGSSYQPSTDSAYKRYLPEYSQNPIPQPAAATACPTRTATPTPTPTTTATPTNTPTPTATALPSFADLGLSVDKSSIPAGISALPLVDVPLTALADSNSPAAAKLSSIKLSSILLDSIKLSSIKLSSIKLSSIQLEAVQLSSIPIDWPGGWEAVLAGTPLEGVPLQELQLIDVLSLDPPPAALDPSSPESLSLENIDLSDTALGQLNLAAVALGPTKLSSIAPPAPAGDWCEALQLAGTSCGDLGYTPSTIDGASLLELNIQGAKLSSIKLSSIKLSSIDLSEAGIASLKLSSIPVQDLKLSSIKLSSIPLETLLTGSLSSTKLSSITLPDGQPSWCDFFTSQGYDCGVLGISDDSTIEQVISAFSAIGTDFTSSPIAGIKLSSIKLSSIDLASLKLSSIPLESLAISGTKLSSIKLSSIDLAAAKLSSIKLSSIPAGQIDSVVDCGLVDCLTATLGDAVLANALRPESTIGHLGSYGDSTIADILLALGVPPEAVEFFLSFFYGDSALGDVANDPLVNLGDLTLGDLLIAMLIRADYPWEDVPLTALTSADLPASEVLTYQATFTNQGGGAPSTLGVTLPPGFHYLAGTSTITVTRGGNGIAAPLEDPVLNGVELVWALPGFEIGDGVTLEFQARPGIDLGIHTSSLSLAAPEFAGLAAANQAPVNVTEKFEPNDDPATAPVIDPDVLYLSHVSTSTDHDFYRLASQAPGARISVYLSNQAQDNDLAIFAPEVEALRPPTGTKLSSIPLQDARPDILSNDPPPGTLQDIDLAPLPLGELSDQRGQAEETVGALSLDTGGYYTLQVAGYNGAASDEPYVLRVKVTPPPPIPACAPRAFAFPGQGVAGALPAALSSDVNTLFIVSPKRLGDLYGAAAASEVMTSLGVIAGRADLGVRGAVLAVDGDTGVAAAFSAWDANPCSPVLANEVVSAINAVVDGYRGSLTALENIVLIGADDVIPFARVPDVTRISNEQDYTNDVLQINGNNGLVGSFVTSNILSDNPYGAFNPIAYLNRDIFLPEVALGRLVEEPAEITAQIDQFLAAGGELEPSTALTTGYDFLSDGATDVASALDDVVGAANSSKLINDAWTAADLATAFDDASPIPGIASINAHFDHYRLLPGAGNTTGDESDLYTSAKIARGLGDPALLLGRILFSMGCHSGLNVPDLIAPAPTGEQASRLLDWPQAFGDQLAAVYVANTGYGYGDTERVAYSEELMSLFAGNLSADISVGEALASAKRTYYLNLAQFQTYDEKVLAQTTFYGLPMFRLPAPLGPPVPVPVALTTVSPFITDPIGGYTGVQLDLSLDFGLNTGPDGAYYTIDGDAQATSGRPIQPVTGIELPAGPNGAIARGIIVTSMESTDQPGFDPVFSKAGSDIGLPEQPATGTFPTSIHAVTTASSPSGVEQKAMFMPAQFISDPSNPATGTERLYNEISAFAIYSNSADTTPPTILETHAASVQGVVAFSVAAEDDLLDNVKRVLVLYNPAGSGSWRALDLVLDPTSERWTGAAALSGSVQYTVYAIDDSGNVAHSTNKGEFHHTIAAPIQSGIAVTVSGTSGNAGWLLDATASIVGPPGVPITVKVDNGPALPYDGPFAVTGTGVHIIAASGADGSSGGAIVPLDSLAPVAAFVRPIEGATYTHGQSVLAQYTCLDAGSGVAACDGTVAKGAPIDTSSPGTKIFQVTSLDVAGNAGASEATYLVVCIAPDVDCDNVSDLGDNCLLVANPDQSNSDRDFTSLAPFGKAFNDLTWPMSDTLGDQCDADDDNDGILDVNEPTPCAAASGPTNPSLRDTDGDFVLDGAECALGYDPASAASKPPANPALDTDNDGLDDGIEAGLGTLNDRDSDDDGVPDGVEFKFYGTNLLNRNSDGDDCRDGKEIASVNADRVVNSGDQLALAQAFGPIISPKYVPFFDFNRDGAINSGDQLFLAGQYLPTGPCQP